MRWPWKHRQAPGCDGRADEALAVSERQYEQARRQRPEVEEVARGHRRLRQENHFAERFARALGEGRR
jgi:hypothetical protein